MALLATNRFAGDGATTSYEINFVGGYIAREHVKAYREDDGTKVRTPVSIAPGQWLNNTTIQGFSPTPVDHTLVIYRDTPKPPMVDFVDGSRFTEYNMDLVARQGLFVAMEALDGNDPEALSALLGAVEVAVGLVDDATVQASGATQAALEAGQAAIDAMGYRNEANNHRLSAADSAISAAASAIAAQNAMDIGTYATSGALADANVFAVKQGPSATAKNTLVTLYTYIRNKLLAAATTWTAAHTFNNTVTVKNTLAAQGAVIVDGSLSAGVSITTPGYLAAADTIACNGGMRSGEHGTTVKQFYMSGTLAPSGTVLTQRALPANVTPANIIGIVAHVRIDDNNHVAPNNADASYRYSVGLASGQVTFRVDTPAQPIMSGRAYRLLGFYLP